MATQIILMILGALFLLAGFLGGGYIIKKIKIPEFTKFMRAFTIVLGLLLILPCLANLGVLGNEFQQATAFLFTSKTGQYPWIVETNRVKISDSTNAMINSAEQTEFQHTQNDQENRTQQPVPNSTPSFSSQTTNIRMASIKSAENFVACTNVDDQNPENIGETFSYGKVYAWAQVHAPREEVLTLKWYTSNDKLLKSKRITIGKNTGDGYRIYDYKLFHSGDDGRYELKLYNSSQRLIGTRQFRIDGQYAGK